MLRLRRYGNPRAATRLFISHGNGFATDGYFDFWSRFLCDFDVVAFDMRNHGHNPTADPAHHDYAHMVRDIDAVCRAARAEFGIKPAVGLFHSMSAQSALLQTMTGEPHFEALILFDPPNVPPSDDPAREPMLVYLRMLVEWAAARRDRFDDPGELARDYGRPLSNRGWAREARELMARAVLRADGSAWSLACARELEASMYSQGATLGLWPRRRDVPVPVTLIGADPDRGYPAASGLSNRALASDGGFDYAAIPGTSHLLQLEEPAACAEAALSALAKFGLT